MSMVNGRGEVLSRQWELPSSTNPNKLYKIQERPDGTLSCDCPRWRFQKGLTRTCPHIITIACLLKSEAPSAIVSAPDFSDQPERVFRG